MSFIRATRKRVKLKLAITGPSGSGKTYSALRLATGLGGKIALIDTENASASLYSEKFNFDTVDITPPFDDAKFVAAVKDAVDGGYSTVIIDSASHFWEGILEYKSRLDARPGSNSYTNWNEAGKRFKSILDSVLQSPIHLIACMRSKMDYILEDNAKGKKVPVKVGLAPIMRDNTEYEFAIVFDVAMDHAAKTSKDRSGLFSDSLFQITEDTGKTLLKWVEHGAEPAVADPPKIGGASPGIAKPPTRAQVDSGWTDEQKTEAGSLRTELAAIPGGTEAFSKLWRQMKNDAPSSVIDALANKLRELRDVEDQNQNANDEER
jgi:hypothetical protein